MQNSFYKIPCNFSQFLNHHSENDKPASANQRNVRLRQTSQVVQSVKEHLDILLLTRIGDNKASYFYGLELWNHNFEGEELDSESFDKKKKDIQDAIIRFEPRLSDVTIEEFRFAAEEKTNRKGHKVNVYMLNLKISGLINDSALSRTTQLTHKISVPVRIFYSQKEDKSGKSRK